MNADGSGQRRLTTNDGFCPYGCPNGEVHIEPVWSPDGKKIAFTRDIPPKTIDQGDRFDLLVINADGSGRRLLQRGMFGLADWGPVPSGAPNPLPAPPSKLIAHPSLTLRCRHGNNFPTNLIALVVPPSGVDRVKFYFNQTDPRRRRYADVANSQPFEGAVLASDLPKTIWIVKAVVSVESESSSVDVVLTKSHAPHC